MSTVIGFLMMTLFNQSHYLVKQGDVEVSLSDLDAYVYLLGEGRRGGFSYQRDQIEKNIYTLLNINIVYQYVLNSDLKELPHYQEILNTPESADDFADDGFFEKLNLDKAEAVSGIDEYQKKIAVYKATLQHLKDNIDNDQIETLAKEKFAINQARYALPEKRDISAIVLKVGDEAAALDMLKMAQGKDRDQFHELAAEHSVDPSKATNSGNWGEYRKERFTFPFVNQVFSASEGVVPQIFQDKMFYYIFRVNEIQEARQQTFDEVKEELVENLKGDTVVRQFQNIINTQAVNKMEVNPELVTHVFERYKVFTE
jgi:hypothetical protein